MQVISAGLTDTGRQREYNEDSFLIVEKDALYIVADGMGGHRAGNVASKMATDSIASFFSNMMGDESTWPFNYETHLSPEENRLLTGIRLANKKIFDASCLDRNLYGMGTTIVGALFSQDCKHMYVAHVGDSRAYRIRDGDIMPLTKDHSLVNDYLTIMPHLTKEQQDELPKNVITRALGMQEVVMVDLHTEFPKPNDLYVLCSDGLSGMVSDTLIRDVVTESGEDVKTAVTRLIEHANDSGGDDNITAVVLALKA